MAKQLGKWLDEFVENGANPNDITDWPENAGGGGGSKIVDSLPAEGVEGSTYLLRHSTEIIPIRFKYYTWIWSTNSYADVGQGFIVTDDYTADEIKSAFLEKISYNIPADPDFGIGNVLTEAEFEEKFGDGVDVVYVSTEEDFTNTDLSNYPEVLQYHGVVGLGDFIFIQRIDSLTGMEFVGHKDGLTDRIRISNNQVTIFHRETGSDENQHGYFEEWETSVYTLAETLTDSCEESQEFWQEHENDVVQINVTSQIQYKYSYTEYVFDHGVYTEISAKSAGASTKKAVAYINDGYPFSITFECDDTSVSTYADLLNYLKTKGYSDINATSDHHFPTLVCSCIGGSYALDDSSITCIYATTDTDWETGQTFEAIGVSNGLNNGYLSLDTTITISFLN